jgi:CheY-like chemotaxis protein
VRHLVELHGGTVQAESRGEGQGATFRVKLPLTRIGKQADFESESGVTTVNLNQLRILVVDDEADVRELLVAILSEYGAQVSVAASAAAALTLLDQFKPDVLISDIGMPGVDGYMLMQQVRQLAPQQGGLVRAIALTAYAGELNQQQALEAGFQKHITKPVEPDELVKTIAALVGRSL